jgi:hypothetical protein
LAQLALVRLSQFSLIGAVCSCQPEKYSGKPGILRNAITQA